MISKANLRQLSLLLVLSGWGLFTKFEIGKRLQNALDISFQEVQIICEEPIAPMPPSKIQDEEFWKDAAWQLREDLPLPMPVPGSVYPMNSVVL